MKANKEKRIRAQKGMTLVEITVVIGLIAIMSVIFADYLAKSIKVYRTNKQSVDLEEKSARVMREFELSTRAATELLTASSSELSFYRYYDLISVSPTLVRYFMNGTTFKVGKTEPVGTPPNISYPPENESIDFLVEDVINSGTVFRYFDTNNTELPLPLDKRLVRMVELSVSLDKNAANPPAAVTESTSVSFRNMKDNL